MNGLGGRRRLVLPTAIVAALILVGFVGNHLADRALTERTREELTTILQADVEALLLWLNAHRAVAGFMANHPDVRRDVAALMDAAQRGAAAEDLIAHPASRELRSTLTPVLDAFGYLAYHVTDAAGTNVASTFDLFLGEPPPPVLVPYVQRAMRGDTGVSRPMLLPSPADTLPGMASYDERAGMPSMFVGAPVVGPAGEPLGVLAFAVAPEADFTRILSVARMGLTGETYAFDSAGTMLSRSRFDSQLVAVGLLPDEPTQTSVLSVQLRDPGGDLTRGHPLPSNPRGLPLTVMAADAVNHPYDPGAREQAFGSNLDGYRDYRGVRVVGAWTWLPEYGFGVGTEVDVAEAYAARFAVRRVLFGLLILMVGANVIAHLHNWRLRCRIVATGQIGPYTLEKLIGEGGMGRVYRASHTLLRRPTAIKLLPPDRAEPAAIRRFEREVRHTSNLTHPNTVAIFDYGRTPDGVFYYAMEYLPGVTIEELVAADGPLPQERVLHVLRQVAGSLAEAHEKQLIHRDIKPSNIMLAERGGLFDFVKVLDFGLVKQANSEASMAVTNPDAITGTPLFMSPEAITNPATVDWRTDLYALGAVAYLMLTGDHVFRAGSVPEILLHHLHTTPEPPSARMDRPLHPEIDSLVLTLLSKDPRDRFTSTSHLCALLDALTEQLSWTQTQAKAWWDAHAHQRTSRGDWHVDFTASGLTPDARSPGDEATLAVDAGARTPRSHPGEST